MLAGMEMVNYNRFKLGRHTYEGKAELTMMNREEWKEWMGTRDDHLQSNVQRRV